MCSKSSKSEIIEELARQYRSMVAEKRTSGREPSELDTQCLLVEPLLHWAGCDTRNIAEFRRANRGPKELSDLWWMSGGRLRLILETKAMVDGRWIMTTRTHPKAGSLRLTDEEVTTGRPIGGRERWNRVLQKRKDGTGQLRWVCFSASKCDPRYQPDLVMPILTDGYLWAIFDGAGFVNVEKLGAPVAPIVEANILAPEFGDVIDGIAEHVYRAKSAQSA